MAFTEKGLSAIKIIITKPLGSSFSAKEIGCAPATMTALCKDGYVQRHDTKPVSYSVTETNMKKIQEDMPKTDYEKYSELEFTQQKSLNYPQLCEYLINKYGKVSGSYFCTPEMKSQNTKIRRANEGLVVHHIKEDTSIMLCNRHFAQDLPWEWQCGENLVYANIFEHALLHMKIVEQLLAGTEPLTNMSQIVGIGGLENYIAPAIAEQYETEDYVLNISREFWESNISDWFDMWCNSTVGENYYHLKAIISFLEPLLEEED